MQKKIISYWHYNSQEVNDFLKFLGYSEDKFPMEITECQDKIDSSGKRLIQGHGCGAITPAFFTIQNIPQ